MIVVLDCRRPTSLGVDVALQLEAFLENSKKLVSQCCVLARAGVVDTPVGLIVPSDSQGKPVQVVCRGRPVTAADVSCTRLVDVQENVYGDAFGWKYLVDATLTATRIWDQALKKIVVLTTDLMLAGEDSESEAARFFAETSRALETQTNLPCISLVFVEVAGSRMKSTVSASDSFATWDKLQRIRQGTKDGAHLLDLIDNTPAMFDSHLRCWLRDSSLRQTCALRLPATETFSGVAIEVEITPYLLDQSGLLASGVAPPLHDGFSSMEVVQGVCLDTLDQGHCRGDSLLCAPSQPHGSPQKSKANRKLFAAVCAELNEKDMGLLLALQHPSTFLQERWLLLPQEPASGAPVLGLPEESSSKNGGSGSGSALVDRALLLRLATKEDVLEEVPMMALNSVEHVECSVERAAACASLEMLKKGAYNPLCHSSGLFERLASLQQARNASAADAALRGAHRHPPTIANHRSDTMWSSGGAKTRRSSAGVVDGQAKHLRKKREFSLSYAEPSAHQTASRGHNSSGRSLQVTGGKGGLKSATGSSRFNKRRSAPFHGELKMVGKGGKEGARRGGYDQGGARGDDDNMML